jgi:hypothetical protein
MAGTLTATTIQNDTSSPPTFRNSTVEIGTLCRAWVNFNGTGTVAIRASFNVSSITDNGTGQYTINITNAMPDTSYAVITSVKAVGSVDFKAPINLISSSSQFSIYTVVGTTGTDSDVVCVAVFR